jgi:hypothetical protein
MQDTESNPLTPPSPQWGEGKGKGIADFGIRIAEFLKILNLRSAIHIPHWDAEGLNDQQAD